MLSWLQDSVHSRRHNYYFIIDNKILSARHYAAPGSTRGRIRDSTPNSRLPKIRRKNRDIIYIPLFLVFARDSWPQCLARISYRNSVRPSVRPSRFNNSSRITISYGTSLVRGKYSHPAAKKICSQETRDSGLSYGNKS